MNPLRNALLGCISYFLLLTFAHHACAGFPPYVPVLQPYQTVSPNGVYLFEVKPSQRYGAGPCTAVLTNTKSKECVWKRELPFTFWQSCVNDDGIVGGFGYSKGPMGDNIPGSANDGGEFVVRILNARGVVTYEETSPRGPTFGSYIQYSPPLSAQQLFLDWKYDRMIIRINQQFRFYSLGEGRLLSAVVPNLENSNDNRYYYEDARYLPDTPFLLLQLHRVIDDAKSEETCFGIMDENGKITWSVKYRNKMKKDEDGICTNSMLGKILSVESVQTQNHYSTHFDIYFGDTKERVTYKAVDTSTNNNLTYKVVEEKRIKWALPVSHENAPPKNVPKLESRKLGELVLLDSNKKPLTEIAAIAMGPGDQIYALDSKTGCVHVFDGKGKPLYICQPDKEHHIETESFNASLTVDDHGEVFVKISRKLPAAKAEVEKPNPESGYFLRFSSGGVPAKELLPPSDKDADEKWLAQPNSNQFLIADFKQVSLVRRDQYSTQTAVLTHGEDGQWFDCIYSVCLAPDGTIAVFSGTPSDGAFADFPRPFPLPPNHLPKDTISLYKPDGTPTRTIDFTAGARLSEIAFDGTHLIATGNFETPNPFVYIFKATGEVVGAIRIDDLVGMKNLNLKPFIVDKGNAILIFDYESGRGFLYATPK